MCHFSTTDQLLKDYYKMLTSSNGDQFLQEMVFL